MKHHRFEAQLGQDYCIRCGEAEPMHRVSLRTEFKVNVEFTVSMDDTTARDALDTITSRVNEMLAVLERKDDVRVVLLHRLEVQEQL